mmetsp:Transcript_57811/g.165814  ORF Transcript_57811/g.165814 Transcript_57811/m.165814 type:complete len:240 (-) Transcript_57811:542-1261(-)
MEHDVLGLDIPVDDVVLVQVPYGGEDLAYDPLALSLGHLCLRGQEVEELASLTLRHHNIKLVLPLHDLRQVQHVTRAADLVDLVHDLPPSTLASPIGTPRSDLHDHLAIVASPHRRQNFSFAAGTVDLLSEVVEIIDGLTLRQLPEDLVPAAVGGELDCDAQILVHAIPKLGGGSTAARGCSPAHPRECKRQRRRARQAFGNGRRRRIVGQPRQARVARVRCGATAAAGPRGRSCGGSR